MLGGGGVYLLKIENYTLQLKLYWPKHSCKIALTSYVLFIPYCSSSKRSKKSKKCLKLSWLYNELVSDKSHFLLVQH